MRILMILPCMAIGLYSVDLWHTAVVNFDMGLGIISILVFLIGACVALLIPDKKKSSI